MIVSAANKTNCGFWDGYGGGKFTPGFLRPLVVVLPPPWPVLCPAPLSLGLTQSSENIKKCPNTSKNPKTCISRGKCGSIPHIFFDGVFTQKNTEITTKCRYINFSLLFTNVQFSHQIDKIFSTDTACDACDKWEVRAFLAPDWVHICHNHASDWPQFCDMKCKILHDLKRHQQVLTSKLEPGRKTIQQI